MNVPRVLDNLYNYVAVGGLLIFEDRAYDGKWAKYDESGGPRCRERPAGGKQCHRQPFWDVMHPVNIKRVVLEHLMAQFEPLFTKSFIRPTQTGTDEMIHFIGRRRA